MSYQGFGKDSGPANSKIQNPYANLPLKRSPAPSPARSPSPSLTWGAGQNFLYKDYDALVDEGTPSIMPFTSPSKFSAGFSARAPQMQDVRSSRSPTSTHSDGDTFRNSKNVRTSRAGFLPTSQNRLAPEQNQSPSLSFQRNSYLGETQQSALPSSIWGDQPKPSSNFITPLTQSVISSVPSPVTSDPRRRSPVQYADIQVPSSNFITPLRPVISPVPAPVTNNPRRSLVQYAEIQDPSSTFITPLTRPVISPVPAPVTNDPRRRSPVQYADIQDPSSNFRTMRTQPVVSSVRAPVTHDPIRGSPVQYADIQDPSSNFSTMLTQPDISSMPAPVMNDPRSRSPVQYGGIHVPKRSRSPTFPSPNGGSLDDSVILQNLQRPSTSPSKSHQQSPTSGYHNKGEVAENKSMISPVAKKSKFPSSSNDHIFQETSNTPEDEANRELQAKAKRLMRFKVELSREAESDLSFKSQKTSAKRQHPVVMDKKKLNEDADDMMGDSFNGNDHPTDYEDLESSGIIVGSCLDMCPEPERGERERKGDLDQFERLDGDRIQTTEFLAVKKYTRTAEREAGLIRPMPVLQKTMEYLLNLLNQPYDDRFLGLYNFLWDRMRAIRMDLRMQHIFGIGAIKMLEQMIRLHIVAMHELCEYTKGEGFSEGFDAHLNIEQMNKTSVELFQLYDDHRKKGTDVVTEKEFRGYYALLKLDKHPGYKVEPAELSLDLAKMTPDIRQTPEVMFARDVARACRTCNFIAFFKLARRASYLQACLMHAHFAKLRTQALAALHSGLQNNQGIPVAQIAEWLGMEEENVEDLLEYHGFSIKEFEVPYMVKDGTFLNVDNDYPVKLSNLVNKKKSGAIYEDVSYPCLAKSSSPEETKLLDLSKGAKRKPTLVEPVKQKPARVQSLKQKPAHVQSIEVDNGIQENDEDMLDYTPSPRYDMPVTLTPETSVTQRVAFADQQSPASPRALVPSISSDLPSSQRNRVGSEGTSRYNTLFRNSFGRNIQVVSEGTPSQIIPNKVAEANITQQPIYTSLVDSVPEQLTTEELGEEHINHTEEVMVDEMETTSYDQEVAEAKLKLILRIWKRLAWKKRELHEQKQLAANAALNSLLLGPPIWHLDIQSSSPGDFDIERVMTKRFKNQEKSLSTLNVSDVVATELSAKNPDVKCLCWKILLLTQDSIRGDNLERGKEISHFAAGSWLLSKLFPARCNDNNSGNLLISSPGVSIWNHWLPSQSGGDAICCLTVIREVELGNLKDSVAGASAILYPVSDCIPWELKRNQLHNVLKALPLASSLPLLIVNGLAEDGLNDSSIIRELRLHDIDKSRINNFLVSFLRNHPMDQFSEFYSDERLREGLKWLAGKSPPQPRLCRIKTREMVLFHLNSSLEALGDMDVHELGPNQCISAFNGALDQSLRKVVAAVDANPSSWPCPEICLLEEVSDEYRAVSRYLPSVGWSSAARIELLFRALGDLKLPHFQEDIRWLNRGSNTVDDIEERRSQLERCIIRYLTESSKIMALPWATQEASIMVQKFTTLELRHSAYYIIPKWVLIFQRIFQWRLMALSSDQISSAYVLAQDDVSMSSSGVYYERSTRLPYLVHPSLDEMVATGYNPPTPETFVAGSGALQPPDLEEFNSDGRENSKLVTEAASMEEDGWYSGVPNHDVNNSEPRNVIELPLATKTVTAADKLSELLDRCNIVQSRIQEKLSIYF